MWEHDPRLDPTPDYGKMGPDSDVRTGAPVQPRPGTLRAPAAVLLGVLMALVFVFTRSGIAQGAWEQVSQFLTLQGKPEPASPAVMSEHELQRLDHQSAQSQAQLLLERAINHYDGATDQVATRVDSWRGKLKLNAQLNSLITTGLNANDLRVRATAIEVDLAAMNVAKTSAEVDQLVQQSESGAQQQRVWALWTLGLLGNRGVESERVAALLVSQLRDPNPEIRHWAVEGLAYLGTNDAIEPLLKTFHDDLSPMVRERAACSLAQSGMLNEEQRRSVVPRLIEFAEDSSLDAQTHTWVYHALRDITAQNLPEDPVAWRNWSSGNQ